jgi:uncharacterized repeat protein (TIGR01451 family)
VKKLAAVAVLSLAAVALAATALGRPAAPSADLSVSNSASASSVQVGTNVTFTIAVTNNGPDLASKAKVTDTLPAALSFVSASSTVGTCSGTTKLVCKLGDLASGAGGTVTLVASAAQAGTIKDTAKVSSLTPDPTPGDNASAASTSGFVSIIDFAYVPQNAPTKIGAKVPWHWNGNFPHTVTDDTGLGLFDSGARTKGATFAFSFKAAGTYTYICTIHLFTGTIQIPPTVSPATGPQGSAFTVTWSSGAPPSGDVFDIQVMVPGGSFADWKTGQTATSGTYTPSSGPGTYSFRARLRNATTQKATGYSPGVAITVT